MYEAREAGETSFLRELVRRLRAVGGNLDAWDGRTDAEVLAPLLVRRDRVEAGAELDADVYLRIEQFYGAVGTAIEARTGLPCAPMLRMHHEGYGRVVLLTGRLVVVSRFVRDVERFGFDTVEKIAEAGERLVDAGVELIARFPEVARLA
jgi:probable nitrogen fixation protein